ncbi:hypothetical protein G4X40_04190 [Rhodococcus sp. D2-41]|uniref:Uncharacterized protein n=1 Tax=Speluncibacter jeojiensis TaxID=2710754 RepID=A0A9X4M2X6_9ACTN|nr:hypothetical protein [Rhodococcus sp. D2-41]MDG3009344.1 hypothetical protein [Rhodococcus sp. D2-41]MDG3016869.1 hypothetical protein [Corynebacteriales bacterium D3-21]
MNWADVGIAIAMIIAIGAASLFVLTALMLFIVSLKPDFLQFRSRRAEMLQHDHRRAG